MKIIITESQYKDFLKKYSKKNQNSITLLELKSMISENKKNIISELEMVELGDTSYSNVGYDRDGTQNDKVYKGLLDDINTAAKNAGIKATITTAKTGHAVHTKGGKNVSRHMKQVAVDVAVLDGIGSNGASNETNGNPKFRELGNKLKDELVKMGYVWNTESGKQKAVLWQTNIGGNHFNHLHISNRGNATEDELNAYANNVEPKKGTEAQKTPEKNGEDKKEKTWAGKAIEKIKKLVAPRSILNDVRDGSVELKYGTRSDQVMQLQKDLKKVGLFNVEPTGYYGPITVKAVKSLQAMEGITVDGIFGDITYAALYDKTAPVDDGGVKKDDKIDTKEEPVLSSGGKGDFAKMTEKVINTLEGGYYHPDMLKDGRVKDKRYGNSGETMFGIDRRTGGDLNKSPEGTEFWNLIDNANARTNWKWNYFGGSLRGKLTELVTKMMKRQYELYAKTYISPEAKTIIDNDNRLLFHFIYATWNGPGWFKKFANIINNSVKNGIKNPNELAKIAIKSRTESGNSLIAQGGEKIAQISAV